LGEKKFEGKQVRFPQRDRAKREELPTGKNGEKTAPRRSRRQPKGRGERGFSKWERSLALGKERGRHPI